MSVYPINHRDSSKPIALVEADSLSRALEQTVEWGVGLLYADLRAIWVPRANPGGGDFRGADLSHARLPLALLHGADLRAVALVGTGLQAAVLWRADLRGTLLTGARLDRAILDWRYSSVPLELLRQAGCGSDTVCASRLLAELAFHDDAKPFAWLHVLLQHESEGGVDWALGVLARHIHPDDGAPEVLRRLAADAPARSERISVSRAPLSSSRRVSESSPLLWTRRRAKQPVQIGPL